MKRQSLIVLGTMVLIYACNNDSANSPSPDSTGQKSNTEMSHPDTTASRDTTTAQSAVPAAMPTDSASAQFLRKAAEGGMAEVAAGNMAIDKSTDAGIKSFATMMVQDHNAANEKVKSLAAGRTIMLPADPSPEQKKKGDELAKKTGKAFDAAFADMMVKDHKTTIALFKNAETKVKDDGVKTFITETLPKLQMHLDSATALKSKAGK